MKSNERIRQCGAKTRQGTPCKRAPRPLILRCNLHGGKSRIGIAHPRFKHGLYSKYLPRAVLARAARQQQRIAERAARRVAKEREQREKEAEALKKQRESEIFSECEVAVLMQLWFNSPDARSGPDESD